VRNLKNKASGEQIQVHEVDARELVKGGLYEDLGAVQIQNARRTMTVAELNGLKQRVENASVKVDVLNLPEVRQAIDSAAAKIQELSSLIEERDARIAELEEQLAANSEGDEGPSEIEALQAKIDALEGKKAAGTMSRTDPALLARYINKLASLKA
jgi:chromosome segregation ATPase